VANDPAFEKLFWMGSDNLVKADLGTKRVCPSCGARFYDLQKRPIECPKCAFAFEPEALYKQRRPRQPEPATAAANVPETDDEEAEDEEVEETEAEEAVIEKVADEPPIETGDDDEGEEEEPASEEAETGDAGMSVVEGEEADIEDIADDEVEEDGDDNLLEEVEEDEDDVSGIIDTGIEKDER